MTEEPKLSPPVLPWKLRLSLSFLSAATDFSRRSDGTVNRRFLKYVDMPAKASPQPINGVQASDITVNPARNLWFRLFQPVQPPPESPLPVLVFFHGGGFSFLSAQSKIYDDICRRFARKLPAVVVSVDYRLSPEHKFPAPFDDGFDTLSFLDERKCAEFPANADLTRCFIAGDSAGGNIAHHVAHRATQSEFNELKVVGVIPIQPFFGGEERTESEIRLDGRVPIVTMERSDWHWKVSLPAGADRDHEAVNVFGPNSTGISDKFPATMVVVGGFDPLQDWQKRYYEGLKRCGKQVRLVEYPNAIHAFYMFPEFPESALFMSELIDFINKIK